MANMSIDPSKSSKPLGGQSFSDKVERQLNAMAHITHPLAWKYDLPVIPEGSIAMESLNDLVTLFNQNAPKGVAIRQ